VADRIGVVTTTGVGRGEIVGRLRDFVVRRALLEGRRAAAVCVALSVRGGELGFWLITRPGTMRTHAGQFALPGGRLDDGEDSTDAGLRELREELGVDRQRADVLGRLDDYPTRSGYVITPIVVWADGVGEPVPNAAEVALVDWVPLRELDVQPRFYRIPESDRPVVQLPLLGHLVHAPTAAILYQFREVVLHQRDTRVAHLEQPVFAWR
jgi:8-oxo-dGTP pyrophosphatase MutT (NUDIX family)